MSVGQSRLQLASTFRPHRPCSPTPISAASLFPGPLGSPSHRCLCTLEPSSGNRAKAPWAAQAPPPPTLLRRGCSGRRPGGSQVTGQAGPGPAELKGQGTRTFRIEETQRVGNGCTCRVGMNVVSEALVPPPLPLRLPQGWGLHCSPKLLELTTGKR